MTTSDRGGFVAGAVIFLLIGASFVALPLFFKADYDDLEHVAGTVKKITSVAVAPSPPELRVDLVTSKGVRDVSIVKSSRYMPALSTLAPGQFLEAWVQADLISPVLHIWQLSRDGEMIVSYEQRLAVWRDRLPFFWTVGAVIILCGVLMGLVGYFRSPTPEIDPAERMRQVDADIDVFAGPLVFKIKGFGKQLMYFATAGCLILAVVLMAYGRVADGLMAMLIPIVGFIMWLPYVREVILEHDQVVIRYPLRRRIIKYEDISKVSMTEVIPEKEIKTKLILELVSNKKIEIWGFAERSPELFHALERMWKRHKVS